MENGFIKRRQEEPDERRSMRQKKITKAGGFTIPRELRVDSGMIAGVPVDIELVSTKDGEELRIRKHTKSCHFCGKADEVAEVCGIEICRECAGKIQEAFK